MKAKLAVLLLVLVVSVISTMAQGHSTTDQGYLVIDQSAYSSLVPTSVWQATGRTDGILSLTSATASDGVGTAWYMPNVPIPISIGQANGTLTLEDNGPTLHPFIPPSSTSVSSMAPILGFVIGLSSPQYQTYPATITGISYSLNGGAAVDIPISLDTSSASFQAIEIQFGQTISSFSLNFDLNLPTGEFSTYTSSEFDIFGISQVPEPSSAAIVGLGAVILGLLRFRRFRQG